MVKHTQGIPRQVGLALKELVTIYKAFVRRHVDYGGILYDQAFYNSFHDWLESIQYNGYFTTWVATGVRPERNYIKN